MVVESEQQYQFHQFVEKDNLPTLDDRSINLDELPIKDDEGSSLLVSTGLITAISGLGIFLAANLDAGLIAMKGLLVGAGIIGLGIGFGKVLLKLLKPRGISLPAIKLKRKAEMRTSSVDSKAASMFGSFREKQGGFRKSFKDKVFTGVCGGIAESSGISSSVLRAIFIAAFAFTGGTAAFIYLALVFLMRDEGDTIISKIGPRR